MGDRCDRWGLEVIDLIEGIDMIDAIDIFILSARDIVLGGLCLFL